MKTFALFVKVVGVLALIARDVYSASALVILLLTGISAFTIGF